MIGAANKRTTLLQPIKVVMYPKVSAPNRPPMQLIDPIHEISMAVNGPDKSGVSSDAKIGNAGETQPIIAP